MQLSLAQLTTIMPRCPLPRAAAYLPFLNDAMIEAAILTPARAAAFLAQLAHESGELRYMEELASGEAYEGRKDLGNHEPGDGKRYKGRGPIQLTGRTNYRAAGISLNLDLEENPAQASSKEVGFRVAAWYWRTRGLNELADLGTPDSFVKITKKINGGVTGLTDRVKYWDRAKATLAPPGP